MLQILRTAVRVLGYSNQQIEDKLGVYHGYLGRLFKGTINLQYDDVVRIARALEMEPREIFQLAHPVTSDPPTEGAQRLREKLRPLQPPGTAAPAVAEAQAPAAAPTTASGLGAAIEQELDRLVQRRLEQLFAGLVKGTGRGE
ncbi:MAG TPA: helix-turn-helix transcriptional regulator [Thermoanaerobaculia bacterium]|nr:helix-turn-helix transcriptional regulator [Thermoanaerobaculia bacterium]